MLLFEARDPRLACRPRELSSSTLNRFPCLLLLNEIAHVTVANSNELGASEME